MNENALRKFVRKMSWLLVIMFLAGMAVASLFWAFR